MQEEVEIVPGRFGSGPAIVFARRVSGLHGEFLGVVTRAITPDQLDAFFASTGLGEESSIAMHHQNGQLLARFPQVDGLIGQNFRAGSPQQIAVFDRGFVTTQLAIPIDGKDRIVASGRLTGEPLVVVATKSLDAALATWRTQTKFFVILIGGVLGGSRTNFQGNGQQQGWQADSRRNAGIHARDNELGPAAIAALSSRRA